MARQPADRCRKSQHRERAEPRADGAVDRQSLRQQPARRPVVRAGGRPIRSTRPWPLPAIQRTSAPPPIRMVGKPIGGVVVFGGGLALYDEGGIVGGLGVSGDSSCADHNVAWRVRAALGLDKVPAGVNPKRKDAIVYDLDPSNKSASGWGHPLCARAPKPTSPRAWRRRRRHSRPMSRPADVWATRWASSLDSRADAGSARRPRCPGGSRNSPAIVPPARRGPAR